MACSLTWVTMATARIAGFTPASRLTARRSFLLSRSSPPTASSPTIWVMQPTTSHPQATAARWRCSSLLTVTQQEVGTLQTIRLPAVTMEMTASRTPIPTTCVVGILESKLKENLTSKLNSVNVIFSTTDIRDLTDVDHERKRVYPLNLCNPCSNK